jgi:hypothetical protein
MIGRQHHVVIDYPDPSGLAAFPYRMAAIQGHVIEVRRDEDCRYLDQISLKYTRPCPSGCLIACAS